MITPEFTPEQMTMLEAPLSGGVIPRYQGEWYLQRRNNGVVRDFGGTREDTETLMETALRGLEDEGGINIDDITIIHGVFCRERSYGVILVEVDKEPIAIDPDATIVRMRNYISKKASGRLFITGLEYKMRDIETADTVTALTSSLPRL
jgi:hypothetical protein